MKGRTKLTLMGYTKSELIESILCLEHNLDVVQQDFTRQYENCLKMIDSMSQLNATYTKAMEVANGD